MPETAEPTPTTNIRPKGRVLSRVRQGLAGIPRAFERKERRKVIRWAQITLPKNLASGLTLENKLWNLEEARTKRVLWEIPIEAIVETFFDELQDDLQKCDKDARGALKFATTYVGYASDELRKAFAEAITLDTKRPVPFSVYCSLKKSGLRFPLEARLKIVERAYAEELARPEDTRRSLLQQALALFPEVKNRFEIFDGRFRRKSELESTIT